jgi:hypothetical protein
MDLREVEQLLADVETRLDRLRALYDQYFIGIERIEPHIPRKEVERRIHLLRKEHIRNTRLRFRFNMLLQRYNMFQTHWSRVCRQIEEGTYRRHVLRAKRRLEESAPPAPAPPPAPASPVPPQDRITTLYRAYVDTRQLAGDDSPAVSLDKMKRLVTETETRLKEKHGREVDFRVEVIEGRAVLRPVLK